MSYFRRIFNALTNFKFAHKKQVNVANNCPCYDKDGNFIGWYSRSVAVVNFVFVKDDVTHKLYLLASQRGKGTPDPEFVGAWNTCCGYLDFGETCEDAAKREVLEETGVEIDTHLNFINYNSDPASDKRENVTFRFYTLLPHSKEFYEDQFTHIYNEKDEVGYIKFIDVEKIDCYKWAFGHDKLAKEIIPLIS